MSDAPSDQDARVMDGTPFADRTRSTTEHGTRIADDRRTHTERINGLGAGRFGDAEDTGEPALTDHDAPPMPYRTTEWSIVNGARVPPSTVFWLQPHEIGPHHVPVEEAMDLLQEIEARLKAMAEHSESATAAVSKMHELIARLEAAVAAPAAPPPPPVEPPADTGAAPESEPAAEAAHLDAQQP